MHIHGFKEIKLEQYIHMYFHDCYFAATLPNVLVIRYVQSFKSIFSEDITEF